jgi:hypothetical protein
MFKKILNFVTVLSMILVTQSGFSTAPGLGTAAGFVLFSTNGGLVNTGNTLLTGNVGTNNGSIGGFGNVNGVMHNADGVTASAATDLLTAYNLLNSAIPTFFPAPLLGNGQLLTAGIYSISESASLNNILYLDGQGNANAEFIIKINGAFSTAALSEVVLLNDAKACNVFWKVEGLIDMASGTKMKGNLIANNGAIVMSSGVELEGRALSTTGAVSVDGVLAFTPIGCGSPVLNGPTAPNLATTSCYAVFSANGGVTNSGVSFITGDVGTNVGLTTGFQELNVTGFIHPIPDFSTAAAAADLIDVTTYLKNLTYDIELLFPAQFGNNLELTPHTYLLNAATVLTDNLYLNALGNADAVFVIKIVGALSTSTYAKVILTNGAQAKNVYWVVSGAVEINEYSEFVGVVVVDNGAIDIKTGTVLLGRALTTSGALSTYASTITMQSPCVNPTTHAIEHEFETQAYIVSRNKGNDLEIHLGDFHKNQSSQLLVYDTTGRLLVSAPLTQSVTILQTNFQAGIYLYKLSTNLKVQTGKIVVD